MGARRILWRREHHVVEHQGRCTCSARLRCWQHSATGQSCTCNGTMLHRSRPRLPPSAFALRRSRDPRTPWRGTPDSPQPAQRGSSLYSRPSQRCVWERVLAMTVTWTEFNTAKSPLLFFTCKLTANPMQSEFMARSRSRGAQSAPAGRVGHSRPGMSEWHVKLMQWREIEWELEPLDDHALTPLLNMQGQEKYFRWKGKIVRFAYSPETGAYTLTDHFHGQVLVSVPGPAPPAAISSRALAWRHHHTSRLKSTPQQASQQAGPLSHLRLAARRLT